MPRPYPKEFREGAIGLAREGDRPVAEIAKELGIAESCLRNWLKQDQVDRRERRDGVTSVEREELKLSSCGARTLGSSRRRRS